MFTQWNYYDDHSYNCSGDVSQFNYAGSKATSPFTHPHHHHHLHSHHLHHHPSSYNNYYNSQSNYNNNNNNNNNNYSFPAGSVIDYIPEVDNDYNNNFVSPTVTSPASTSFSSSPPTPEVMWDIGSDGDGQYASNLGRSSVTTPSGMSAVSPSATISSDPTSTPPTPSYTLPQTVSYVPIKTDLDNCAAVNSTTTLNSQTLDLQFPNFQATKRQLIKEGLKVTIQSKRMAMGLTTLKAEDLNKANSSESTLHAMSMEDEERRRRRRERNKVAATKCRNKKKYHVSKLSEESDTLEVTNSSLREEMINLEKEQQRLLEALNSHLPCCQYRKQPYTNYVTASAM